MTNEQVYSRNERAEKLVGFRDVKGATVIINFPGEMGFKCPVCKNQAYSEEYGMYDERLEWSEYNGFLWCSVCNFDFVSALCVPNLDTIEGCKKANDIFLRIVEDARTKK